MSQKAMGNRLKNLMEEKQLSLRDLAKKTGIASSTIQRYTAGLTADIPISKLQKLAPALGTTVKFLETGEDDAVMRPLLMGFGEDDDDKRMLPVFLVEEPYEYFWLELSGEELPRGLKAGQFALVHRQKEAALSDVAVYSLDSKAVIRDHRAGETAPSGSELKGVIKGYYGTIE